MYRGVVWASTKLANTFWVHTASWDDLLVLYMCSSFERPVNKTKEQTRHSCS